MNNILKRTGKYMLWWLATGAVLLIFLLGTDPLDLSLPVLLVPFGLFFIWTRTGIITAGLLLSGKRQPGKKLRILAGGFSAVALLTITLQSLGQLSWRDIMLVAGLVAGLAFYLNRTDVI